MERQRVNAQPKKKTRVATRTADEVRRAPGDLPALLVELAHDLQETIAGYLRDHEWLARTLDVFGARLLGRPMTLLPAEQRILETIAHKIAEEITRERADKALRMQQRERIDMVRSRKIRGLSQLATMDPEDFEYWGAGHFIALGFRGVLVTRFSSDFGIDIYMTCPNGTKAVAQVKRYDNAVGRPVVQQTYGAMKLVGARRCYVVTNSTFSGDALALQAERKDIFLIDGEQLWATYKVARTGEQSAMD